MAIYFCFSDEHGSYRQIRTRRFLRAHPYYLRSAVLIDGTLWKSLERRFSDLLIEFDLPQNQEIKWSYAWSLRSHAKSGKRIREKDKYFFLKGYDPDRLEQFLISAIDILATTPGCKIIVTITDNSVCPRISEQRLLKMHLQESMQRLEMEMSSDSDNLCVLFVDPISDEKDKTLREAYSELYRNGDLIDRYAHIKDSLNLEYSHHSVGVQMADYVCGAFGSLLNSRPLGSEIYERSLSRVIRRSQFGVVAGYGIREVPSNRDLRATIMKKVEGAVQNVA